MRVLRCVRCFGGVLTVGDLGLSALFGGPANRLDSSMKPLKTGEEPPREVSPPDLHNYAVPTGVDSSGMPAIGF
jgi:hypothetical protein